VNRGAVLFNYLREVLNFGPGQEISKAELDEGVRVKAPAVSSLHELFKTLDLGAFEE
jgi:hypothetical protein